VRDERSVLYHRFEAAILNGKWFVVVVKRIVAISSRRFMLRIDQIRRDDMGKEHMMQLAYDREADVLYLSVGEPRPAVSREVGDDVLLRIDPQTGEVVGLTVLNLSTRNVSEMVPVVVDLHEKID
jgi:uncharacterized protein YuzE